MSSAIAPTGVLSSWLTFATKSLDRLQPDRLGVVDRLDHGEAIPERAHLAQHRLGLAAARFQRRDVDLDRLVGLEDLLGGLAGTRIGLVDLDQAEFVRTRVVQDQVAELVEHDDAAFRRPHEPLEQLCHRGAGGPAVLAAGPAAGQQNAGHHADQQRADGQGEGNRRGHRPIVSGEVAFWPSPVRLVVSTMTSPGDMFARWSDPV